MSQIQSIAESVKDQLTPLNIPFYVSNTDLIAGLFIIVKPLTLSQVDGSKFTSRVNASSNPLPLARTC